MTIDAQKKCGYVAIVGRPNVGKSTLLNRILGEKLSITSRKPQTTRHRIVGIKTQGPVQAIYVDTPGLHKGVKKVLNRYMNKAAFSSLKEVDVVIFVVESLRWTDEDSWILSYLKKITVPVILVLNKVDTLQTKTDLLPYLQQVSSQHCFTEIVPISAIKGNNIGQLEKVVSRLLPNSPWFFPEEQLTDRGDRFLAAETVREKLIRNVGEEVPHSSTVSIEKFAEEKNVLHIAAIIYVEKEGQKAIIIGKQGQRLKEIGKQARLDLEKLFERKVFLQLWVKVKRGWSEDEKAFTQIFQQ